MLELSPFQPMNLVVIAALNPLVVIVAVLLGRGADQWQKLPVAGFAAALVGAIGIYFAVRFGLLPARGMGGEAGVFVASIVIGTFWAWVGSLTKRIGDRK